MVTELERPVEDLVAAEEDVEEVGHGGDIKKAKDAGFHTCESMLMQPKKRLVEIKGLSEAKIDKLVEASRNACPNFGIMSARDFEGQITEIFGEWRTGKTQLCHTLCVTTQMGEGLAAGRVAYFDTEGTFRPERIRPIAERFNLDGDAVLSNVLYARAYTFEQQYDLLEPLAAKMAEEPFKLLIMDSIAANMRVDYSGRGELAERQQKLGLLMNRMRKLADEFNIAILITNQVISDPSGGAMFVVDPKKPVGGHVMAHASTIRLSVRKGKAEQRLMKVVDAPNLAEAEASYAISGQGIIDYKCEGC
ncbi:Meiotic recombination protein DMC1-like protein [Auxenochlorella protothecoides]|uniref:Meiotic recombination protein DMC1-like protein n=1 Tax=Auxenochlorella protothecoides TaxID=3075 RepID=A0A087SRA0_AUXPR|nr:Meiotic recombination protein DMC1-like protein [Auxenochlorella protothecoides]KFM28254.1 Meiotic recombination protein DMC1-like protein [Auxenochlorella protothecoides]RMZ52761.1 hypothetical protein APUTEX25_000880 [Auxenochlorella protothecoides]|eukprot:RMZ52761.1 hypothetical protein APUTEX25_000880 [Auxenochlorella protothecoides]